MAEMQISADLNEVLITYALGSCLGLTIYDPVARIAGMLHAMLPDSSIDTVKASSSPSTFIDTGVPALFKAAYALGARKERIVAKVAGGAKASLQPGGDYFQIGKRNFLKLREMFWRNGVLIAAADVGGAVSRTMLIEVGTGNVHLRMNGSERPL
jgi:chemotaxis protein CheD